MYNPDRLKEHIGSKYAPQTLYFRQGVDYKNKTFEEVEFETSILYRLTASKRDMETSDLENRMSIIKRISVEKDPVYKKLDKIRLSSIDHKLREATDEKHFLYGGSIMYNEQMDNYERHITKQQLKIINRTMKQDEYEHILNTNELKLFEENCKKLKIARK